MKHIKFGEQTLVVDNINKDLFIKEGDKFITTTHYPTVSVVYTADSIDTENGETFYENFEHNMVFNSNICMKVDRIF